MLAELEQMLDKELDGLYLDHVSGGSGPAVTLIFRKGKRTLRFTKLAIKMVDGESGGRQEFVVFLDGKEIYRSL